MSTKKPVMGRGLEALLGQMSNRPAPAPAGTPATATPPAKLSGDELANLPVDLLQRGKYQPRVDMRQETLHMDPRRTEQLGSSHGRMRSNK